MTNSHEPLATSLPYHALTESASPPIDRLLADLHRVVIESQSDSLGSATSTGALYRVSSLTLVAGWLATVLTSIGFHPKLAPWALTVLLCGIVSTVGLGAPSWIRAIREWRSLEADAVAAVGRNLARWHHAILQIRATYTHDQLTFGKRYVSDVASQFRGRIAFISGAFDKVGPAVG